MIKSFKEYFDKVNKLKNLVKSKESCIDAIKRIKTGIEIMNLELELFDFSYGIKHLINDNERCYLKLKYMDKVGSRKLEHMLKYTTKSLKRHEKIMLEKVSLGRAHYD